MLLHADVTSKFLMDQSEERNFESMGVEMNMAPGAIRFVLPRHCVK